MVAPRSNSRIGKYNFDESKFRKGQRRAAALMVQYEFTNIPSERMTMEEIANEVGVHRSTLYEWSGSDANFIEYKNYLAAQAMDSFLPLVYDKLIDGINHGSMKGIELFLKRIGDMDSRSELTINDGNADDTPVEERAEALKERLQAYKQVESNNVMDEAEEAVEVPKKSFSKDG